MTEKRCQQCRQTFWRHPKSNMTRCQDCPPPLKSYPMRLEGIPPELPEKPKTRPKSRIRTHMGRKLEDAEKTGSILANLEEEE